MSRTPFVRDLSRREVLGAGAGALALAVTGPQLVTPAQAQMPKRAAICLMWVAACHVMEHISDTRWQLGAGLALVSSGPYHRL